MTKEDNPWWKIVEEEIIGSCLHAIKSKGKATPYIGFAYSTQSPRRGPSSRALIVHRAVDMNARLSLVNSACHSRKPPKNHVYRTLRKIYKESQQQ